MNNINFYSSTDHSPRLGSGGAAGFDLPTVKYDPNSGVLQTGIHAAIPPGHVGLLLPRSSAGTELNLELKNTVGVIDSDYRGEIIAKLKPLRGRPFTIGGYHLQLIILRIPSISLTSVENLSDLGTTERGSGGFGSTGGE